RAADDAASPPPRSRRAPSPRADRIRARPRQGSRTARASSRQHLGHNDVRTIVMLRRQRTLECVVVVPVRRRDAPSLELEARADAARPVVCRAVVVDGDGGEAPEADPAGVLHRLPVAPLVELAVADEAERAAPGERYADGDPQPVPER